MPVQKSLETYWRFDVCLDTLLVKFRILLWYSWVPWLSETVQNIYCCRQISSVLSHTHARTRTKEFCRGLQHYHLTLSWAIWWASATFLSIYISLSLSFSLSLSLSLSLFNFFLFPFFYFCWGFFWGGGREGLSLYQNLMLIHSPFRTSLNHKIDLIKFLVTEEYTGSQRIATQVVITFVSSELFTSTMAPHLT